MNNHNEKMEIGIGFWQKGTSLRDIEIDLKHPLRSGLRGVSKAPFFRQKNYTDSKLLAKIDLFITKIWTWINLHQTVDFNGSIVERRARISKGTDVRPYIIPAIREIIRNVLLQVNPIVETLTPAAGKFNAIPPPSSGARTSDMEGVVKEMEKLLDYRQAFNILHEFDRFNRRETSIRPIAAITDAMYHEQILRLMRLYHVLNGYNTMGAYAKFSDLEGFDPNKEIFIPDAARRVKNGMTALLDPRGYVGAPFLDVNSVVIIGSQMSYNCPHCSQKVDIGSLWSEVPEKEPERWVTLNHDDNTFYHACFGIQK